MTRDDPHRLFHSLLWPERARVLRVALILCGNDAEAEDLAQETMLKAFRAIGQFRPGPAESENGDGASKWLLAILRNTRIDRLRARAREAGQVSLDSLVDEPADDGKAPGDAAFDSMTDCPEELLERFTDREMIAALQALPEAIRWTLLLADVERMDHRDVGETLGIPAGTVKSRVHRGRAMLRKALAPRRKERT
ncbi:MAG: sigma-70 family RNA polymerase sigma factor [Planctomycetota bacterium]|nr:sigma-70 family RNA polymerase sigma factor [Planctomycetota bacterium]